MNPAIRRIAGWLVGAAFAAPTVALGQFESSADKTDTVDPSAISAKPLTYGVFIAPSLTYASIDKRSLEVREVLVGAQPFPSLSLWYARQNYLLKGRSDGRARLNSADYGLRWIFKGGKSAGEPAWAFQFQAVIPDDLISTKSTSTAIYYPTKINVGSVSYYDGRRVTLQALYGNIKGHASGTGDLGGAGASAEWPLMDKWTGRAQGQLMFQYWKGAETGHKPGLEVKPVLSTGVSYHFMPWLALEGDVTVMPMGLPLVAGRLTGLGSFLLYQPGGPAADLRSKPLGYATLRLVGGLRF